MMIYDGGDDDDEQNPAWTILSFILDPAWTKLAKQDACR